MILPPRLKELLKAKDAAAAGYATDVRAVLSEVRRQISVELLQIPGDVYPAHYLKQNLASIERLLREARASMTGTLTRGIEELAQGGAELLGQVAQGTGVSVGFGWVSPQLLDPLQAFGEHLIGKLTDEALGKIRGELTLGALGNKTPQEITRAITGTLRSRGIFTSIEERAEVITKTELGRAHTTATHQSLADAAASVPGLEKQWWHAGHPATPRRSHLTLDGQHVPVDKPFVVGSVVMQYPRDPNAPAGEVIRCGCELLPYHPAWAASATS